jgi:hypothetical protein
VPSCAFVPVATIRSHPPVGAGLGIAPVKSPRPASPSSQALELACGLLARARLHWPLV